MHLRDETAAICRRPKPRSRGGLRFRIVGSREASGPGAVGSGVQDPGGVASDPFRPNSTLFGWGAQEIRTEFRGDGRTLADAGSGSLYEESITEGKLASDGIEGPNVEDTWQRTSRHLSRGKMGIVGKRGGVRVPELLLLFAFRREAFGHVEERVDSCHKDGCGIFRGDREISTQALGTR